MSEDAAAATRVTAPPVVLGSPTEIADGVWVVPDGRVPLVPNIGVIVGDRAVLVVDTGLGAQSGANTHAIARELAGDRPLLLTLTHFHPEHGWGAQAFADAIIVYNRTQRDEFRAKADGFMQMFRGLGDAVARELEGFEFVAPHLVYDGAAELDLGGKLVQLRTWGAAHSAGDQAVLLPEERVAFLGDLAENRFFPIFPPNDPDVDGDRWIAILEELEQLNPAVVVPGHGEVGDAGLLTVNREYLQALKSETGRLAAAGKDPAAIIETLTPQLLQRHSDWDQSETWRIATGALSFLGR